jgi:hypothetical protein
MRIYHFVIIFAIFALSMVIIKECGLKEKVADKREKTEYKRHIEKAAEAAAWELRAAGIKFDDETGKRAIDAFCYSLFAALGIMDNVYEREQIKERFPSFTVFLNDGYYIFERTWVKEGAEEKSIYIRSQKMPYDNLQDSRIGFMCSYGDSYQFSADVSKRTVYIVDTDDIYHEEGCGYSGEIVHIVFSKEGCAMLGAHPCKECIDR